MHRIKKKNTSQVNAQLSGENTGEEATVQIPGPVQQVDEFQLNAAGGPLDEEFREKGERNGR